MKEICALCALYFSVIMSSLPGHQLHVFKHDAGGTVVHERGAGIAWRIWPSAHYLLHFLVNNRSVWEDETGLIDIKSTHMLELGAGVGLVGICCASQLPIGRVTLTDIVLEHLTRSVEANEDHIRSRLRVERLEWGKPLPSFLDDVASRSGDFSAVQDNIDGSHLLAGKLLVVASDVVYWESLAIPLADTLRQLCTRPGGAVAYIAQRKRDWRTERRFFTRTLRQCGLRAEVVSQAHCVELEAEAQAGEARILVASGAPSGDAADAAPPGDDGPDPAEWNTRIYKITLAPPSDGESDGSRGADRRTAHGGSAGERRPAKEKQKRGRVPPRQQKSGRWH